jgi:hypothetical protein
MSSDFMAMGYEDAGGGDIDQGGEPFETAGGVSWDAFEGENDQDFVFGAAVTMDDAPGGSGHGSSHVKSSGSSKHGKGVLDLLTTHAGEAYSYQLTLTIQCSQHCKNGIFRFQQNEGLHLKVC